MIEELVRRLDRSPLGPLERRGVAAMQRAGIDPALLVGALRLGALGRVRLPTARALAGVALELARHRRMGPQGLLRLHALSTPDAPAVIVAGAAPLRLSFGQLDERIRHLAWGLHDLGVRPGDRVAQMLDNGVEPIELAAALGWLGASLVQVGGRLKAREVGYLLADSGARALVLDPAHVEVVREALADLGARGEGAPPPEACLVTGPAPLPGFGWYRRLLERAVAAALPAPSGGGMGGVILYTSGTTGQPKGAARDYRAMGVGPILNFVADLPLRHDERFLLVTPLYHSAGAFFSQLVLGLGGALVIHERFEAAEVVRAIERERVTSAALVPTMLARLLALDAATLRGHDRSSLRFLISVAAPLPTELARRAEEELGPRLYNFYAATETGVVTLARPGEHTARPGTIGRAVLGSDVRLLDEAGRAVAQGEVGELYVRSAMMMGGYHNRPGDTAAATRDGYVSVGDLARVDEDGYYYLADRKSDLVISGGVNIYPFEIEQRLHAHPAVADCAIVGVPDAEWGESLCAFVVLRPGHDATAEALAAFVTAELADYKRPRRFVFVAELPRNPTGKVDKRELRRGLPPDPGQRGA